MYSSGLQQVAWRGWRDRSGVAKQQRKHNILFARCSSRTHSPTEINLHVSNFAEAGQAQMSLSENWELLNNQSQHSQKERHEPGIKEWRSSLSNCYYTLESNSSSEWLPDHIQGRLDTSIRAQLLDNMANKIPGYPKSY